MISSDLITRPTTAYDNGHYVVCIGASAGGMEALHQLFDHLSQETGFSFIVIQHLSSDHKSLMAELLAKHTTMKVVEAAEGTFVRPNSVYVIPNNRNITIGAGRLHLREKQEGRSPNMAIDIFLQSLARDAGEKAIAVILSGTGTDGTRGIEEIKNAGGLVFVQDPSSAKFDGMPMSAIASGKIDFILSPESIAEELLTRCRLPSPVVIVDALPESEEPHLQKLFGILQTSCGCDFSNYKRPTIIRRLTRRMAMANCTTLPDYLDKLETDGDEASVLCREFLIGVTRFFRDPEAFNELQHHVISRIMDGRKSDTAVKVWVPGCSTGEEAYSIAILLREALLRCNEMFDIKIFASDVNRDAIEFAGRGVYPGSTTDEVPEEYLKKYFTHEEGHFRVCQQLRKMVIFSHHDVLKHPPFGKLDLISCRNMLIYLSPALQKRVLSTFHFSLNPDGYLLLGPSENIGDYRDAFTEVNKKWRLFRKEKTTKPPRLETSLFTRNVATRERSPREVLFTKVQTRKVMPETILHHIVDEYGLAGAVVDSECNILESFGNYRRYLHLPEKKFDLNLLKMLPSRASVLIGSAFRRAITSGAVEHANSVWFTPERFTVNVSIKPIRDASHGNAALIVFSNEREVSQDYSVDPMEALSQALPDEKGTPGAQEFASLQEELKETREILQNAIEEAESTNEELQSANEELISANEELQSANEELQSLNEELHTLNAENQMKIREITELNDDLNNYFRASNIGKIFLDSNLLIRKFTPAVTGLINVIESDIGRSITHISNNLPHSNLIEDIHVVLRTSGYVERELRLRSGACYQMRILPYIREGKYPDGVVLIFVDITDVKRAEEKVEEANQELKELNEHLLRSNRELEQFAYITSHDLQEPLRKIQTFSDLIKRDPMNTDVVSRYLDKISGAAVRMSALIRDVLSYSRLTLSRDEAIETDLNSVMSSVLEDFELLVEQKKAHVNVGRLMAVMGMPTQLNQLFMNLLSNALKFCDREPEIHITSAPVDQAERDQVADLSRHTEYVRITISDNGIGFDQQYAKKIFTIFQRLNHRKQYAGTGIGLALCKRIVENHRGAIFAQSKPGNGTVFVIYLPAAGKSTVESNDQADAIETVALQG